MIDRDERGQHDLTVATFANPYALIMKGKRTSTVLAWICGECGYVEFYVDDPQKLQVE